MTSTQTISLAGKVAFVSGASKGIGVAIAGVLANAGADLALTARNEEELEHTAEAARKVGSRVWTRTAEMADADEAKALGKATLAEFGHIDILVNNAGVTLPQTILETEIDKFHTVINVNLLAPLLLTQIFVPSMIEKKRGKIINISSVAAKAAKYITAYYATTKMSVIAYTQALAREFAAENINVNAIAPGYILTDLNKDFFNTKEGKGYIEKIPMRRLGLEKELDGALLLLASDASNFMTGSVIAVDGGHLVNPL